MKKLLKYFNESAELLKTGKEYQKIVYCLDFLVKN